jgi:hypothetical protein
MKSTLEEAGTSVDAFAKGIFTAQRNLGQINSSTDQAAIAIKQLGLDLNTLRNATPERFLEIVAEALNEIHNPTQRAAAGAALLGRSFQELAPAVNAVAGRLEELRAKGMSPEDIKRLDDFGDALTRISNAFQVMASGPLAAFANGLQGVMNILRGEGPQRFAALESSVKSLSETVARTLGVDIGRVAVATTEQLEEMARSAPIATKAAVSALIAARREFQAFIEKNPLGTGPGNIPKPPPAPFRAAPDPADAQWTKSLLEESRRDLIAAIEEEEKKSLDAGQTILGVFKEIRDSAMTPLEKSIVEINARFDEMIGKLSAAGETTGQTFAPLIERLQGVREQALLRARFDQPARFDPFRDVGSARGANLDDVMERLDERLRVSAASASVFGKQFDQIGVNMAATRAAIEDLIKEGFDPLDPTIQQLRERFDSLKTAVGDREVWTNLTGGIRNAIDQTLTGLYRGTQDWGDLWINLLRNIAVSAGDAFSRELTKSLFAGESGGLVGGLLSSIFGSGFGARPAGVEGPLLEGGGFFSNFLGSLPGFAEGGVVPGRIGAPKLALVHGGETITPPGGRGGIGGINVTYAIDARGAERGVEERIMRALKKSEKETVSRSVAAVREERQRSSNYAKAFR